MAKVWKCIRNKNNVNTKIYMTIMVALEVTIIICFAFLCKTKNRKIIDGGKIIENKTVERSAAFTKSKIATNNNTTAFLKENGDLYAWGYNGSGQLGAGDNLSKEGPILIATRVTDVSIGYGTMAYVVNGNVYVSGLNSHGELANGTTTISKTFSKVSGVSNVKSISCGSYHVLALRKDGQVYGWGYNANGQLGDGTSTTKKNAIIIPGISGATKVCTTDNSSFILKEDGTVWTSGYNGYGQLGLGNTSTVKEFTVSQFSNIVDIVSGNSHVVAMDASGNVYSCGLNSSGQLGLGDTKLRNIPNLCARNCKAIAAGDKNTYIVTNDNKILSAGSGSYGNNGNFTTTSQKEFEYVLDSEGKILETEVDSIFSGNNSNNAYIINSNGEVYGWGKNDESYNQLLTNRTMCRNNFLNFACMVTGVEKSKRVTVMEGETIDLNITNECFVNTLNLYNIQDGSFSYSIDNTNIATVDSNGILTGISEGDVVGKITNTNGLEMDLIVEVKKHIAKIEEGTNFVIMLKDDGTLWSLGYNSYGQLGNGTKVSTKEMQRVKISQDIYLEDVVDIAAGGDCCLAVTRNGDLYFWGNGTDYVNGIGTTTSFSYAQKVTTISGVIAVDAVRKNYSFGLCRVIKDDGSIYAWGYDVDESGGAVRTKVPTQLKLTEKTLKIEANGYMSLMIKSNHKAYVMTMASYTYYGNNINGNYFTPILDTNQEQLENITDIAVTNSAVILMDDNGYVYGMGSQVNGQLGLDHSDSVRYATKLAIQGTKIGAIYATTYIATESGNIYASGRGSSYGELGNNTLNNSLTYTLVRDAHGEAINVDVYDIVSSSNGNTAYVISEEGIIYGWGYNFSSYQFLQNDEVEGLAKCQYAVQVGGNSEENIWLNKYNLRMQVGETETILPGETLASFSIFYSAGGTSTFEYSSSNDSIVQIDQEGNITANGIGNASICVRSLKTRRTIMCDIKVGAVDGESNPMVTATENKTTIVLKKNGTVWGVGTNQYGELAQGTTDSSIWLQQVKTDENTTLQNVVKVASGRAHVVAITADGNVYTWGQNNYGQLGLGDTTTRLYATKIESLTGAVDIACGYNHTAIVLEDGSVYSWGYNGYGQLGLNDSTNRSIPTKTEDIKAGKSIEAGKNYTVVLLRTGEIKAVGEGATGQLGNNSTSTKKEYVNVVNINGTGKLSQIVKIGVTGNISSAIDMTGKVYLWGENNYYQLGGDKNSNIKYPTVAKYTDEEQNEIEISGIVEVGGSAYSTMLRTNENEVYVAGLNTVGQLGIGTDENQKGFKKILAGEDLVKNDIISVGHCTTAKENTYIITRAGFVYVAGDNTKGQIGNGKFNSVSSFTKMGGQSSVLSIQKNKIKIGESTQIEVETDDKYFNVFVNDIENSNERMWKSSNENVASVEEGIITGLEVGETTIALKTKIETVITRITVIGENLSSIAVPDVKGTELGSTIVLREDGTVWTVGSNENGELGIGNTESSKMMKQVKVVENRYLKNIVKIATGRNYVLALSKDGEVYSWGANSTGQLGLGDTTTRLYATKIEGLTDIVDIAAGYLHSVALTKDGRVYSWGHNSEGQLGIGNYDNSKVPNQMTYIENGIQITAGRASTYILSSESNIYSVGINSEGELGDNTRTRKKTVTMVLNENGTQELKDIMEVSSINVSAYALNIDGNILGWGDNTKGQLCVGAKEKLPTMFMNESGNSINNIISIGGDGKSLMILTKDKKAYSKGENSTGQLGVGDNTDSPEFKVVIDEYGKELTGIIKIGSGAEKTGRMAVIKEDGTVWSTGNNSSFQLGNESNVNTNRFIKLAEGFINYPDKVLKLSEGEYYDIDRQKVMYTGDFNVYGDKQIILGTLTYNSANTEIATVTERGTIRALKEGTTKIEVKDEFANVKTNIFIKISNSGQAKVVCASYFTLVLKTDGTVYSTGYNQYGRLGIGVGTTVTQFTKIESLKDIVDISAGTNHGVALTSTGLIYTWGNNQAGQLGIGNKTGAKNAPVQMEYLIGEEIIRVEAYNNNTMALSKDGRVFVWGSGYGTYPQEIKFSQKIIEISGNLVLGEDRRVYSLDEKKTYGKDVIKLSVGGSHSLAINGNGEVFGWGSGSSGQLGNGRGQNITFADKVLNTEGTAPITDIFEVSAGTGYSIIMDINKNVYSFGNNSGSKLMIDESGNTNLPIKVVSAENTETISASRGGNYSIISNWRGLVYVCGGNYYGQLGTGERGTNANKTSLTLLGEVQRTSEGERRKLTVGEKIQMDNLMDAIFTLKTEEESSNDIEIKEVNGDIVSVEGTQVTGINVGRTLLSISAMGAHIRNAEVEVLESNNISVESIESGESHSVALKSDGTVWTWGENSFGQLGNGTTEDCAYPNKVEIPEIIKEISVGNNHTLAIAQSGVVYAWGNSEKGQVGNGTTSKAITKPVKVLKKNSKELNNVVRVVANKDLSYAITMSGEIYSFGNKNTRAIQENLSTKTIDITENYILTDDWEVYNKEGEKISTVDGIKKIEEGQNHLLMHGKGNKVYALGDNTYGQLGNGTTSNAVKTPVIIKNENNGEINEIKDIETKENYSVILTNDGKVYIAGDNTNGVLGNKIEMFSTTYKQNTKLSNINNIDAGAKHLVLETTGGIVYAYGNGTSGQLGNREYLNSTEPVVVGTDHIKLNTNYIVVPENEAYIIKGQVEVFNLRYQEQKHLTYTSEDIEVAQITNLTDDERTNNLSESEILEGIDGAKITGIKNGTAIIKACYGQNEELINIIQIEVIKEGTQVQPMISTKGNHTVALMADGTVWAYGDNTYGQLGNGNYVFSDQPVKVSFGSGTKIVQISAGENHSAAIDSNGYVYTWGKNDNNQLGNSGVNSNVPYKVVGVPLATKVECTNNSTFVITKDGGLYGWGSNGYGELGCGDYESTKKPTKITKIDEVLDLAGGKCSTVALLRNGTVYATGLNKNGSIGLNEKQLNEFTKVNIDERITNVDAGDYSTGAITLDGEVYTWGKNTGGMLGLRVEVDMAKPTKVLNASKIRQIEIGTDHTILRDGEGKVYVSGCNELGQLGNGTTTNSSRFTQNTNLSQNVIRIAAGNSYSAVCTENGQVYAWGNYMQGDDTYITKTNSKIPILIGSEEATLKENDITVGVKENKNITMNPRYSFNLVNVGENSISTYSYESLTSTIATVNKNGVIQGISMGTTWIKVTDEVTKEEDIIIVRVINNNKTNSVNVAPKVEAGKNYAIAMKQNGEVYTWGNDESGIAYLDVPQNVNILSSYIDISAGDSFAVALREDGTVWTVGSNDKGQLGFGNYVSKDAIEQVPEITNVKQIAAGLDFVIALDEYGKIYGWGSNSRGQLGQETTNDILTPKKVDVKIEKILQISAGKNQSVMVTETGKVYGLGDILNGYMEEMEGIVKAQVGDNYILVLKSDGKVYSYESGIIRQVGINTNNVDISVKGNVNSSLTLDKKAYISGENENGQLGNGTMLNSSEPILVNEEIGNVYRIGTGYNNSYVIGEDGTVYAAGDNTKGQLGNGTSERTNATTYGNSVNYVEVGDRDFTIDPEVNAIELGTTEVFEIKTNKFNVFTDVATDLSEYSFVSNNEEIITVPDVATLKAEKIGTTGVMVTDNVSKQIKLAKRIVVDIDQDRLSSIQVNGCEGQREDVYKYQVDAEIDDNKTEATLKVQMKDNNDMISIDDGNTWSKGSLNTTLQLEEKETLINIMVENENGIRVSYVANITRRSNNTNLETLKVKQIEPTKLKDGTYEMIIKEKENIDIMAKAESGVAKISIDHKQGINGSSTLNKEITSNETEVIIEVTAECGIKKEYKLKLFTKECFTELDSVKVNGTESKTYDGINYEVNIEDEDMAKVYAKTKLSEAKVKIEENTEEIQKTEKDIQILNKENVVKITVSIDVQVEGVQTIATKDYYLKINKTINYSKLKEIRVNELLGGEDLAIECKGKNVYEVNLLNPVNKVEVNVTSKYETANIRIDEEIGKLYTNTKEIEINKSLTEIPIIILGEDEKEVEYTLIIKTLSDNYELEEVKITTTISEDIAIYNPTLDRYEVRINQDVTEGNIYIKAIDQNATITLEEISTKSELSVDKELTSKEEIIKTINVKAQNNIAEKEYILSIQRKSTNAELNVVEINGENLENSGTEENPIYEVEVPSNERFNMDIGAEDENAEVTVNGDTQKGSNGIDEIMDEEGTYEYNIKIVSEDGTTSTEATVKVKVVNTNRNLSEVAVEANSVTNIAEYNDKTKEFYCKIEESEKVVLNVTPENLEKSKVSINGSDFVLGKVTQEIDILERRTEVMVDVMSEDGGIQDYIVVIELKSNDVTLKEFKIDEARFFEEEEDGKYKLKISEEEKQISLTAIPNSEFATVKLDDGEAISNMDNNQISIEGRDTFKITVIAEDGTIKENIVIIERVLSLEIEELQVNSQVVEPKEKLYDALIQRADSVLINIVTKSNTVKVQLIKDEEILMDQVGGITITREMLEEKDSYKIRVYTDEENTEEYNLNITKKDNNTNLEYIKVDNIAVEANEGNYEIYVEPNETNSYNVQIKTVSSVAQVKIDNNEYVTQVLEETYEVERTTTKELAITVQSQNGEMQTYTLRIINISKNTNLEYVKVDGTEIKGENNVYTAEVVTKDTDIYNLEIQTQNNFAQIKLDDTEYVTKTVTQGYELKFTETEQSEENEQVEESTQIENIEGTEEQTNNSKSEITILVKVKSEFGNESEYTVIIKRLSNNTKLSSVVVNEEELQEMDCMYQKVEYSEIESENITIISDDENATIALVNVQEKIVPSKDEGVNKTQIIETEIAKQKGMLETSVVMEDLTKTMKIIVTAEDGTSKEYSLEICILLNDKNLSKLEVSNHIVVKKSDSVYEVNVVDTETEIEILARTSSPYSKIKLENNQEYQEVEIFDTINIVGVNAVVIEVKAQDGSTNQYTLNFKKEISLDIQNILIDDNIATKIGRTYKCWAERHDEISLQITTASQNAIVELIKEGTTIAKQRLNIETNRPMLTEIDTYTVKVYGDGNNVAIYNLEIIKKSANVNLSYVKIDGEEIFDEDEDRTYEMQVAAGVETVTIETLTESEYAQVKIDTENFKTQLSNKRCDLEYGVTTEIIIIVKSQSGIFEEYRIRLYLKSNNNKIETVLVNNIESMYDADKITYTSLQRNITQTAFIRIIPEEIRATIKLKYRELVIDEQTGEPIKDPETKEQTYIEEYLGALQGEDGILETNISLVEEITDLVIEVTAEDGTRKDYKLNIEKKNDDNSIGAVFVNDTEILPNIYGRYTAYVYSEQAIIRVEANNVDAQVKIGEGSFIKTASEETIGITEKNTAVPVFIKPQVGDTSSVYIDIEYIYSSNQINMLKVNDELIEVEGKTYKAVVTKNKNDLFIMAADSEAEIEVEERLETGYLDTSVSFIDEQKEVTIRIKCNDIIEEYILVLVKASTNTGANVFVDDVELLPGEEELQTGKIKVYRKSIDLDKEDVKIRVIAENMNAKIKIGDNEEQIGETEVVLKIPLQQETVIIPVTVLSADKENLESFNIKLVRNYISNNLKLDYVIIDDEEIQANNINELGEDIYLAELKNKENMLYNFEIKAVDPSVKVEMRINGITYSDTGVLCNTVEIEADTAQAEVFVISGDGNKQRYMIEIDKELRFSLDNFIFEYDKSNVISDSPTSVKSVSVKFKICQYDYLGQNKENFNVYQEGDGFICGLYPKIGKFPGITVEKLISRMKTNSNTKVKFFTIDRSGEKVEITSKSTPLGTGTVLELTKGEQTINLTIVVKGDINGDGRLSAVDISMLNASVIKGEMLDTKEKLLAVDVDLQKGYIRAIDSSKLRRTYQSASFTYMK